MHYKYHATNKKFIYVFPNVTTECVVSLNWLIVYDYVILTRIFVLLRELVDLFDSSDSFVILKYFNHIFVMGNF